MSPEALAAATDEPEPDSLGAAARMRARFGPDASAAALSQASLRRAARAKFGVRAAGLFFTRSGLEQATRPEVAAEHARRFVAAGATRVIDLGCGIGSDALAFLDAGLDVVGVEVDPVTAAVARANLGDRAIVTCAEAQEVVADLLTPGVAVFCDPARRNERSRLWRVEDFSPPWSLVTGLLDGRRPAGVKLGPALPWAQIPEAVEAEWVSHHGDVVEVALWAGGAGRCGVRGALLWPQARLAHDPAAPDPPVRPLGAYLYEPDGAVIRARGIAALAETLGAGVLDPHIAYLTADRLVATPFATAYQVLDRLPFEEKVLRRWVADRDIGSLEIKKRGVEISPERLRARLRPRGTRAVTLIISRTPRGALVAAVERVGSPSTHPPSPKLSTDGTDPTGSSPSSDSFD